MRIAPSTLIVLLVCCLAGGAGGYFLSGTNNVQHHVLVTLESSVPIETQLYYDSGKGFNEGESVTQPVYRANLPVTLSFDIPSPTIKNLRFDPGRSHARVKIFEIMIHYHKGGAPFTVPLESLMAARDIQSLQYDGRALNVVTAETAQDPILLLGRIGQAPESSITKAVLFAIGGVFAAFGIAFFIRWVYRNSLDPNMCGT